MLAGMSKAGPAGREAAMAAAPSRLGLARSLTAEVRGLRCQQVAGLGHKFACSLGSALLMLSVWATTDRHCRYRQHDLQPHILCYRHDRPPELSHSTAKEIKIVISFRRIR